MTACESKATRAAIARCLSPRRNVGGGEKGWLVRRFTALAPRVIVLLLAALVSRLCAAVSPGIAPAAGVSFEQRIGEPLPLDQVLRDENGQSVPLGRYFGRYPVVLIFGYSRCPQLCTVVATGVVETLRAVQMTAGTDYAVVYVSIDPTDSSRELAGMKRRDVRRYGRGSDTGWHYLGGDERAIRRVTEAAGFHFTYDERQRLYAHASGFLIATPDGRIARYALGVDFDPRDVAGALRRAAEGKTGSSVYNLLLVCARGLGITGRYGRIIWVILEISVSLTVLAVFGGIAWMLRQERRGGAGPACDGAGSGGCPGQPVAATHAGYKVDPREERS